jgi:4-amino-4-deoxy-L-arabinose transferase-like glycosyltransferase
MRSKPKTLPVPLAEQFVVTKGGEPPGPPGASTSNTTTSARRWRERIFACAAVVFAVVVAFGLRAFRLGVSWDVYIDEFNYLQISQGVLHTLWVIGPDGPFYLHPPGLFFLEAAYIKLFGIGGDLIHQLFGVRYLVAALAGLSAGALLWSGRRLAGWPAGIAAAAFFALDPFCIKMNSHNMLDTPTTLWVLLGYGVLLSALVREDRRPVSWWRTVAAGVLFGLALLTKEVSVFITLLPLGVCFVLGWALARKRLALAGVVALIVYALYPAIVYAIGDWELFLDKKFDGISRLAGLVQFTGFNQRGGPSFLGAIVSKLDEYAMTYVLLATGAVAVCVLLLTSLGKAPAQRLLVSWTSSAYALLAYITFFGTLEDQFFYYLVVPSILATTVTTALVLRKVQTGGTSILATTVTTALVLRKMHGGGVGRHPAGAVWRTRDGWRGWRLALEVVAAVFVVALALFSAYIWAVVHTIPDNGYQRVASYVEQLPGGSRVAVTSQTAELLIERHVGGRTYTSVEALREDNIDYVVINEELVNEGWEQPPPEVYQWVRDHGRLVYGFVNQRSAGLLGVWRLQDHAKGTSPLRR